MYYKIKLIFKIKFFRIVSFFVVVFGMTWCFYQAIEHIKYNYCYSPLSYIIITGNRYFTTNDDICHLVSQIGELDVFIKQDVNVVQKKIEQLPWIQRVSVRKQWPDTLKIHLVEHTPIAYWNDILMISSTGVVFEVPIRFQNYENKNDKFINMPILYGPNGKEQDVLNKYLIFSAILESNKFYIQSLSMNDCCSWELILKDNLILQLGRDNFIKRLCYFIRVYPILFYQINKQNKYIEYVDLRYDSGCAIRLAHNMVVTTPILYNK